jgi:hypothetical protein
VSKQQWKPSEAFNELDELELRKPKKSNRIKDDFKSKSSMMKLDCARNLIIDFPAEHQSTKLFLILFDVYDCEAIKSVATIESSFKALVNLFPRNSHYNGNELNELSIKSQSWHDLLQNFR